LKLVNKHLYVVRLKCSLNKDLITENYDSVRAGKSDYG